MALEGVAPVTPCQLVRPVDAAEEPERQDEVPGREDIVRIPVDRLLEAVEGLTRPVGGQVHPAEVAPPDRLAVLEFDRTAEGPLGRVEVAERAGVDADREPRRTALGVE